MDYIIRPLGSYEVDRDFNVKFMNDRENITFCEFNPRIYLGTAKNSMKHKLCGEHANFAYSSTDSNDLPNNASDNANFMRIADALKKTSREQFQVPTTLFLP